MSDIGTNLEAIVGSVHARRAQISPARSLLFGVSGIDGAGKGYIASLLAARLQARGLEVAAIGIDGWLNLPAVRFGGSDPGRRFYEHAIRFEALFHDLVLPLQARRSCRLTMDYVEETATTSRPHTYEFHAVDVILLEGVFLFTRSRRRLFDYTCWVDCTFETALERALARGQEGLSAADTRRAYETIYFPAQRLHFALDEPQAAVELVLPNDPRLTRQLVI